MIIKKTSNMKKTILFAVLTAAMLCACNPDNDKGEQPDPVGTTYPRVNLIEHFTGQGCGYCPYGMNLIQEVYGANPDGYVWISNHTYGKDEYTISSSNTVAKKLGVLSAPCVSINRIKHDGEYNYHPYYTAEYMAKEATTASSIVSISRTYDPATKELKVTVSGKTSDAGLDSVLVTLAITESGLVGAQSDYYYSWQGWKKFTHTHAVRAYVSSALGDAVKMKNRTFSKEYTTTLKDKWVAENCEIVAWITSGDNWTPVLNAAKLPVVEGTKGGEDILFGGIEEYPVPDTYPESGAPCTNIALTKANGFLEKGTDHSYAILQGSNPDTTLGTYSGLNLYPLAVVYVMLPAAATALPAGTYSFVDHESARIGDAIAGYRNNEEHELNGSIFMNAGTYQGEIFYTAQWMLAGGSVTVTETGLIIDATTKNGSPFHAEYTGALPLVEAMGAPARRKALLME